jgi:hypothetical protein
MTTTSNTGGRTEAAASTAADETRQVGRTAAEEARNVAGEATAQVRNLADEARLQIEEQSRSQRDRLVSTLSTFSDDLDSMSRGEGAGTHGLAADAVRMASDRARQFSYRLEGREPQELLDELRSFARRRPGMFLLGSLAAGVVAGRLLRGAKDASDRTDGLSSRATGPAYDPVQATATTGTTGTTVGDPTATAVIADEPTPPTTGTTGTATPAGTTAPLGTSAAPTSDTPLADEIAAGEDAGYGAHRGAR